MMDSPSQVWYERKKALRAPSQIQCCRGLCIDSLLVVEVVEWYVRILRICVDMLLDRVPDSRIEAWYGGSILQHFSQEVSTVGIS